MSREVMQLDASQVRETAIGSLAASLHATVVAPVLWFVVAGLPGAVLYRFARTADAMWGYRGFRAGVHWEWAGKWAARADDALSWVPARLAALLLALVAGNVPLPRLREEARRSVARGSGWPRAALALALGVRLRGPAADVINTEAGAPASAHTEQALRLCGRAIGVLVLWAVLMAVALRWGRTW